MPALSANDKHQLDTFGFLVIRQAISKQHVDGLRQRCAEALQREGEDACKEFHQEQGTDRLANLIDKGREFRVMLNHLYVQAAIHHVLDGDVKLSSCNARFALPGCGAQGLHTDGNFPESFSTTDQPMGTFNVCNSLWLLDDLSPENGATRIVPGSHRSFLGPAAIMDDICQEHPAEKSIRGHVGDVVVFNSHLWHAGSINTTQKTRRCIHGYFTRRAYPQQTDMRKWMRAETVAGLSAWERWLCDV